jgi:tetratricopeptide (TPR) repeat protein
LLSAARDERAKAEDHLKRLLENPYARKRANGRLAALAFADGDQEAGRRFQRRAAELPDDLSWIDPFFEEMKPFAASRQYRLEEAARLERDGRMQEAVKLLRQVVADIPDADSYLALGLALTRLHQYAAAESTLRSAIQLGARQMQAHHVLATLLFIKAETLAAQPGGKEKCAELFRQVVAAEDKALALKGDYPFAHLTRGRALTYLGQPEEALHALRKAVLYGPELADTHYYLGQALAEAGKLIEALAQLEDASRLAASDDPRPRRALTKWRAKIKK